MFIVKENNTLIQNYFTSQEEFKKFILTEATSQSTPTTDEENDETDESGNEIYDARNENKELEFEYAVLKNKITDCIFKRIIIFTNNRDIKENKSLKNLYDYQKMVGKDKLSIYPFVSDEVEIDQMDDDVVLRDSELDVKLGEGSNIDTLVITRLGIQGERDAENAIGILQDYGFLVLNPLSASKIACDKYETSVLLQKYNIAQPNFCLLTKEDITTEDDVDNLTEALKNIFEDYGKKEDTVKQREFVLKILDGHGGTGVTMCNGGQIRSLLQLIFEISPDQKILVQQKLEGDGGDIRVHVLTQRHNQVIIGAMKRHQVSKSDFRSNVSLGATAEKIKLTHEQEQLALHAAQCSGLVWAAVDILPLKKGSYTSDNVILEINASPGTDGISEVLGVNFFIPLINNLKDPKQFKIQNKTIGYKEAISITISEDDKMDYVCLAKMDTGNNSKGITLMADEVKYLDKNVTFKLNNKTYTKEFEGQSEVRVGDNMQSRNLIKLNKIKLGTRIVDDVLCYIVDNRKTTDALINRQVLSQYAYIVDSSKIHILSQEMEMVGKKTKPKEEE